MRSVRDAFDHLMTVDVEALDGRGAEDALRCARQLRGWIDARMITLARHLDALHATGPRSWSTTNHRSHPHDGHPRRTCPA